MRKSFAPFLALQEAILVILAFPIWWYGAATARLLRVLRESFGGGRRLLHLQVLLRHLFDPLFGGDGTREMHLISVAVRIPFTLGVALYIVLTFAALCAIFLAWIALPVVIGWGIAGQLGFFARV